MAPGEELLHHLRDLGGLEHRARAGDERAERAAHLAGALEALVLVPRERLGGDGGERLGHPVVALVGRRDRVVQDGLRGEDRVVAAEQVAQRQALPEADPEREDVDARVHVLAAELLRSRVGHLALEHAGVGLGHALEGLGAAEVHDLDRALVGHEEVLRRHVAVDDVQGLAVRAAQGVRRVEALGGVRDDPRREVGHRVEQLVVAGLDDRVDDLDERRAHEVLHRDVVEALDVAEVVDRADVRVADVRRDLRLVEEHVDEGLLLREVRVDRLDRDVTLEARGEPHLGEVDGRHAACAELLAEGEPTHRVGEHGPERQGRPRVCRGEVGHRPELECNPSARRSRSLGWSFLKSG